MGVSREEFYESGMFAIVPMDFYFPVMGNQVIYLLAKDLQTSGNEKVLALAPDIQLTILVGNYAQRYYLHQKSSAKLTDTVKHYKDYLPEFFPLVHPSPRNNIWQAKNPWFMEEVVPDLKNLVKDILIK